MTFQVYENFERLQILSIGSTYGSLLAVRVVYFMQGSFNCDALPFPYNLAGYKHRQKSYFHRFQNKQNPNPFNELKINKKCNIMLLNHVSHTFTHGFSQLYRVTLIYMYMYMYSYHVEFRHNCMQARQNVIDKNSGSLQGRMIHTTLYITGAPNNLGLCIKRRLKGQKNGPKPYQDLNLKIEQPR